MILRFSLIFLLSLFLGCGKKATTVKAEADAGVCAVTWNSDGEQLVDRYQKEGDTEVVRRFRGAQEIQRVERLYKNARVVEQTIYVGETKISHSKTQHSGDTLSIEQIDDSDENGEPGVDGTVDVVVTTQRQGDVVVSREIMREGFGTINVVLTLDEKNRKVREERRSNDTLLEVQTFEYDGDLLTKAEVDLGADSVPNYIYRYEYGSDGRLKAITRSGDAPATFTYAYQCSG